MRELTKSIHKRMEGSRGDLSQLTATLDVLERRFMEPLEHNDPDTYWSILRDIHQANDGCHYDAAFAQYEVSRMYHISKDGSKVCGAHWTMEAVEEVYRAKKSVLPDDANVYDLYVAVNGEWHDKVELYRGWFKVEDVDAWVIDSAIGFYFGDVDAPSGKVWRYHNTMR